ncbi:sensor domain-containing diguanylate cyclase [Bacillus sp. FJAT-28004]|uniref:sensor domain-containing diguanylate cyclase n=1 Tax=Bacillus sp. FJAT-28004 TaxID=1679165 RepID=UPI0006B54188|nr:sensor domain-containing diguanylate cyclase [Bacillus sp. FJAT-28004]
MIQVLMTKPIQKKKVSLTTLLIGLVSISVFLMLTISLFASYQSKKQALYETTLTLNLSTASKMSITMGSLFESMRSSLNNAANFYSLNREMELEDSEKYLELIRNSSNYFNSIAVVDEKGLMRTLSPSSIGKVGEPIKTEAAKEALAMRKPYLSKPYRSATTKHLIVFISEPLFDQEGVYRGFIGGSIYLQQNNVLNMIFGNENLDDNGSYFYVVGSDGHLMYDPDTDQIGMDVTSNPIVQKLVNGKSGQELTVDADGVRLLAGYAYVPENQWGVVVLSPISIVKEQLNNHIQAILLYTLIPFFILMLVTTWFARRLAKPFVTLANIVSKMGKVEVPIPAMKHHWNREADLLTKTVILAMNGIKKQTDQLTQAAMTDVLTGLNNRRTLETIMMKWVEEQKPYSIVVLDIDRFKSINDTYGHQEGDRVLQHLAKIIKLSVKPDDICSRYGGEEFVVLLPHATPSAAFEVAERIRTTIENSENHLKQIVTVSLGVAQFPSQAHTADELFSLADQALYKAKHAGRNQTVMAE